MKKIKMLHEEIPIQYRDNLKKLAKYLLSGKLKASFAMNNYSEPSHTYADNCGTVGCAIGHGPHAGVPKTSEENWVQYSRRCFAAEQGGDTSVFDFLFAAEWAKFDKTAQGAGERIMYALKYGVPQNSNHDVNYYIQEINYTIK
jgi:hypothetical protein